MKTLVPEFKGKADNGLIKELANEYLTNLLIQHLFCKDAESITYILKYSIPDSVIDEVRDRTDIVEVVSQFVTLKKVGKNFKGLCPFHSEKTPSFTVSPEKRIYHCFGCGAGGNVFKFVMKLKIFRS
ncbi:MAG: hypothetical protein Ct9H300mP23_10900 [Nitrospinota bacterium]|nr:MAG: hypothetical protein Ct9H300mP23_10900 [Nitrospinota bacterium]